MTLVCSRDGVEIALSRSGAFIHLDEIPKGVGDHEIVGVDRDACRHRHDAQSDLKMLVDEMVLHHATLHQISECPWAQKLLEAARRS